MKPEFWNILRALKDSQTKNKKISDTKKNTSQLSGSVEKSEENMVTVETWVSELKDQVQEIYQST